jgi:DNA repair photolyase
LYADLLWRPIGGVKVGDELAGFDEHPTPTGYRYFRPSTVESVWWSTRPVRRLITSVGDVVTTDEHRWLRHGRHWWVRTRSLDAGRGLRLLPVEEGESDERSDYRAGYLTGITIGDGTFRYQPGWRSDKLGVPQSYWRVAMRDREPLDRVVSYLATFGAMATVRPFDGGPRAPRAMQKVEVRALDSLATIHAIVSRERATSDYYRGFLAGFFDADGSFHGSNLRFHQVDRDVLERIVRYGARLGFAIQIESHARPVLSARLPGSLKERMRFFAVCRPAIIRKYPVLWHRALELERAQVEAVERGPVQDVVDIQTSTHTFFAAGLATHNCYARASHAFLELNVGEDFSSRIFVKGNVAAVLRRELARPAWGRERVAVGTATDPYQAGEGRYRLTRACLEALVEHRTPATVTTKGTLVVRDTDVLQALAAGPGGGVNVSLITLDEAVWRALEPGAPPPRQRLRALRLLADAGVPCGLALAPVLPGLTDAPEALEDVVRAAADAGARWLWAGAVHLEPAVRDWFLGALGRHFPRAVGPYARVYGAPGSAGGARYAPRPYANRLAARVGELRARYGLTGGEGRPGGRDAGEAPAAQDARHTAPGARPAQLALPL